MTLKLKAGRGGLVKFRFNGDSERRVRERRIEVPERGEEVGGERAVLPNKVVTLLVALASL